MSGTTPSTTAGAESSNPGGALIAGTTLFPVPSRRTAPDEPLLRSKYQQLTRKHLSRLFDELFAQYTGLQFHIAWAPAGRREWEVRALPTGCSECCRIAGTDLEAQPLCKLCGPRQLVRALRTGSEGLNFRCRLGVLNFWLPIRVRSVTIGIAYLQTLDRTQRPRSPRLRIRNVANKSPNRAEFRRAGQLLRLIVEHVQTLDLAELRKVELVNAGHALLALEKEQARLHEALKRHVPASREVARRTATETHADRAVRSLLEWIAQDYAQPITLRGCAGRLGMNATYLSALFSQAVGRPFKTCLTERRMEQARTLLSEGTHTAADVAAAVGYASENRFRIAFKKATGLAPKLWRQTMQMNPPSAGTGE